MTKNKYSSKVQMLLEKADRRTTLGRKAYKIIPKLPPAKLGLIYSISTQFPHKKLDEILNVDVADYQHDVEARCVGGHKIKRELYVCEFGGHITKETPSYYIHEKIKARKPFRKQREKFILGPECYKHLPELLYKFGFKKLKGKIKDGRKESARKIKRLVLSSEARKRLQAACINEGQFAKISSLIKNLELEGLETRILYELDPGKKNGFSNWFREGIKSKAIDDKKVIRIYNALLKAPQLLEDKDLAKLVVYQYEFRKHPTKAIIGNVREDMFYLDSSSEDDELLKKYGKPNLDKHYVRPATPFRKRGDLEEKTIREKLNEEYLTFVEALGIHAHFPEIEKIRVESNKEITDKYGIGRTWSYLLEKIRPLFEKEKKKLASEYKEIKKAKELKESVLTKQDYLLLKDFFKRASLERPERKAYLKFYSIKAFREAAPRIVVIGRKARLAEKNPEFSLKTECLLKEDLELRKYGIEKNVDDFLGFVGAAYLKNKNFIKFKEKLKCMNEMAIEGLVEKTGLERTIEWHKCLEKEKVKALDESTKQDIEYVNSLVRKGLVIPGDYLKAFLNSNYSSQKDESWIKRMAKNFRESFRGEKVEEKDYSLEIKAVEEYRKKASIGYGGIKKEYTYYTPSYLIHMKQKTAEKSRG